MPLAGVFARFRYIPSFTSKNSNICMSKEGHRKEKENAVYFCEVQEISGITFGNAAFSSGKFMQSWRQKLTVLVLRLKVLIKKS